MKKYRYLERLFCFICCLNFFIPTIVIAETVSMQLEQSDFSEPETTPIEYNDYYESDMQRAVNHYKYFFEKNAGWDANSRIGTVEAIWQDMFSEHIHIDQQVLLKPKSGTLENIVGTIHNNFRNIHNVQTDHPNYSISNGNIQGIYKDAETQQIKGINLTGDVEVVLHLSDAGMTGTFKRLKAFDYLNPSSSIFNFAAVESYGYLTMYTYGAWTQITGDRWGDVVTNNREPLSFTSTADISLDLSRFFTVMTQTPDIKVTNLSIYTTDPWIPEDSFVGGTGFFGEMISYSDLTEVQNEVNLSNPGTYRVCFDYYGYQITTYVTVHEDKSTLKVKDSSVTAGSKWDPEDNFVSATEKSGKMIPYSTTNIRISGTVNTHLPGEYPIVYTSYDANGNVLQTETARVTVVPASVQVFHIDLATDNVFDHSVINGVIGETFQVKPAQSENYKFRYAKINNQEINEQEIMGAFTEGQQTINFYYNGLGGNIQVLYLEEGTNKILAPNSLLTGFIEDSYIIDLKSEQHRVEGYRYVRAEGELTGQFDSEEKQVTLYYIRETPTITPIDFSFGKISKTAQVAFPKKTSAEMSISLPIILANEEESSWRFSATLEQPFASGNHQISSQLVLSDIHFEGNAGSELLDQKNEWHLTLGVEVPLARFYSSRQENRTWKVHFGEEKENIMSGVALNFSTTEVKNTAQYSSSIRWTLTNEP